MSLVSATDDFFGSLLNSNVGTAAANYFAQKSAADLARDQAKAQADLEAARLRAATAANSAPGASGGLSTQNIVLIGAGVVALGLGAIILARSGGK